MITSDYTYSSHSLISAVAKLVGGAKGGHLAPVPRAQFQWGAKWSAKQKKYKIYYNNLRNTYFRLRANTNIINVTV